ncbi:MAG: hypothetical protein BM563_01040 [Bacteroidetes bacterium MedPE-SWsnd-G1]|nr:MAG: hypothetical protein BM563_01040 [Bacteroidetes bacterium MedPE-SWsnd-G1]
MAQELPPIQNYTPNDYLAENQNWSISQSEDGYIYVANNRGLLEFNGADWTLYPSPNNSTLRSVKVVGDRIYTGCYREFGYWIRNEFGKLEYTSLSNLLGGLNSQDQHFWNIEHFEDGILFQSLKNIYILNTLTEDFQIINSDTQIPKVFVLDNGVYYQRLKYGIYKLTKGIPQLISSNQVFKDNIVVNISREDDALLFQTKETGFYFLRDKLLSKWNIEADNELSTISVYNSERLNDGSFVVGSISNGVYHINSEGEVVLHVNRKKGINNNTVLSQFIDKDDNLWLGLDIGISVLNLKSPYRVYNDVNGVLGSVYASEMYNGNLYLGTNQGLFFKEYDSDDDFKFIEGTEGQVWCLKQFEGTLFCGHNNGTYVVSGNEADLIVDFMGTWDIKKIPGVDNLLLQGHYGGLSLLEKRNENWVQRNLIEGYSFSSRYFVSVSNKEILVNSELSGIDRLLLSNDYTEVKVKEKLNDISPSAKSGLVNYNDLLLYASSEGLFEYSNDHKKFLRDSLLTDRLFGEDKYVSGRLIADSNNKLWGFTDKNIVYFFPGTFDRHLRPVRIPLTSTERRFISDFENITRLKERTYLFGSSGGYFIVDLDDFPTEYQKFEVIINSIQNSTLNGASSNVKLQDELDFNHTENNFIFKYNVPQFDKFNEINYQYKLEGYIDNWSSWSSNAEVSFDNLPYGKYVFRVRARVSGEISDNEASYQFKISSPWYLTYTALVFYASGMFVLMFTLLKMSGRYYKKEREILLEKQEKEIALKELESSQQLMKIRNDSLRMDIESKNRELAISTMSLIKKNEFLSDIKTELDKPGSNSNLKSVMNIIDKNLNSNDDWNLFKEAFNNADREFFKKIKDMHPALTPNDLKLCAFLRLNLSSKEIAPLLNISTRSVEIKRYRLRKKMDLPHETNLVQHILAV